MQNWWNVIKIYISFENNSISNFNHNMYHVEVIITIQLKSHCKQYYYCLYLDLLNPHFTLLTLLMIEKITNGFLTHQWWQEPILWLQETNRGEQIWWELLFLLHGDTPLKFLITVCNNLFLGFLCLMVEMQLICPLLGLPRQATSIGKRGKYQENMRLRQWRSWYREENVVNL